jgi:hypothetical protein
MHIPVFEHSCVTHRITQSGSAQLWAALYSLAIRAFIPMNLFSNKLLQDSMVFPTNTAPPSACLRRVATYAVYVLNRRRLCSISAVDRSREVLHFYDSS